MRNSSTEDQINNSIEIFLKYNYFCKLTVFLISSLIITFFIYINSLNAKTGNQFKRHITIYGNSSLLNNYTAQIANDYNLVITEWWRSNDVIKLKKINPSIITLFYRDLIGVRADYDDWLEVSKHDNWFVRDEKTGKRIKHKIFGWYLMDISNNEFRKHLVNYLSAKIKKFPMFDGVFLDDVQKGINLSHYVIEGEIEENRPNLDNAIVANFQDNVRIFLEELKITIGGKLVIINTDDDSKYIESVDGMMFEGFVHGSWEGENEFRNVTNWYIDLEKLKNLSNTGKYILVQPGTKGEGNLAEKDLVFCLASFLLVCNEKTFFYFEMPSMRNKLPDIPKDYLLLGEAKENISIDGLKYKRIFGPSLGKLEEWNITGKDSINFSKSNEIESIKFNCQRQEGCFLSRYFQLSEPLAMKISCKAKGLNILIGDTSWKRFAILGKFFDKDKKIIKGGVDLIFDIGTYDWKSYEATHEVPLIAKYYLISAMGFFSTSSGIGWVSDLKIETIHLNKTTFSRKFENGNVFVKPINYEAKIDIQ